MHTHTETCDMYTLILSETHVQQSFLVSPIILIVNTVDWYVQKTSRAVSLSYQHLITINVCVWRTTRAWISPPDCSPSTSPGQKFRWNQFSSPLLSHSSLRDHQNPQLTLNVLTKRSYLKVISVRFKKYRKVGAGQWFDITLLISRFNSRTTSSKFTHEARVRFRKQVKLDCMF